VLKERESAVSGRANEQKGAANPPAEQQTKQQSESATPDLNGAVAAYHQKVAVYDFAGALAAVASVQVSDPKLKSQHEAFVQKARWLAEWKEQLITAINERGFTVNITDKTNVAYAGIASANETRLTMKLPYGQIQIEWTKLTPQTLLALATAMIPPRAHDAADRQWRCAVFAAETEQPVDAQRLGRAAASAQPGYRASLPLLSQH
jgi:hypothetical protein